MHHVNRMAIITAALAAALPACRRPGGESEPRDVVSELAGANRPVGAPAAVPADGGVPNDGGITIKCDQWGCGSNTAQIMGKTIGALHIAGTGPAVINENGFSLAPTLRKGGVAYRFDISNGEIVGAKTGEKDLRGKELVGSELVLHSATSIVKPDGSKLNDLTVTIRNVAKVPLWTDSARHGDPPKAENLELAFAYELEFPELPEPYDFPCKAVAWGWSGAAPPAELTAITRQHLNGYKILSWTEAGHYAVLVKGETYDAETAAVDKSGALGAPWFNIACPGTALSKMKLLGYDPEQQGTSSTTPDQRQATLRMITARYCGKESYTVENTPLVYQNAQKWFLPDFVGIKPKNIGAVEAVWGPTGAVCLNEPRKETRAAVTDPNECGPIPTCDSSVTLNKIIPTGNEWVSLHRLFVTP